MTRALILILGLAVCGCGLELKPKETGRSSDVRGDLTGLTPAQNLVSGTTVDAKISVTPSAQVVRGISIGAKISVQ